MTTTMATASRARLFGDADTGLFSKHRPVYSSRTVPRQKDLGVGLSNGGHGSKCFCCPYGYHIDLDFVRYCESWQAAASDRIARGNEEKRRRRARQRQCQSMEFLLGLPDEKEQNNEKPSPAASPSPKATPPKPPPKPSRDSVRLNQEWHDTLSNFEQALSQSYTGPSLSACSTPISHHYLRQVAPETQEPRVCYLKSSSGSSDSRSSSSALAREQAPKVRVEVEVEEPLPSSRLVLQQQSQESASRVENRPCLQSIREQMAAALERMKQLEEQVKEIPLLHVQMSVLREERRILLRQLAAQRKLGVGQQQQQQQVGKRDVGTSCTVVTRDIGVSHQQTKCREASTNTVPASPNLSSSAVETTSIPPSPAREAARARLESRGTQCQAEPRPPRASKSVQCGSGEQQLSSSKATQCEPEVEPIAAGRQARSVQCSVETRERGTLSLRDLENRAVARPLVLRKNKEVQATESQPWAKLKLNMGVMVKPSVSDASTETLDATISLAALRRQQQQSSAPKSVGVNVTSRDLVPTVSRSTETLGPRLRDFGTSPQRKLFVDVSVGGSLPTANSTNYCDECKQISRSLSGAKAVAEKQNAEIGQKRQESTRTRIPVKNERRATLIRQDTWTESLDKLADGSQSLNKYADRLTDKEESECRDANRLAAAGDEVAADPPSETEKTRELKDCLGGSMVLETPKVSAQRPPMELSREMRAALKVLDDNLRKVSAGGTLPSKIKNASNIVQHEWFKISSTAQADPLSVDFYLDQFEQQSSALLGHVVNLTDSNGNTAMHYAVSHDNFDVVSILLDSKVCDVNRSNNAGYTPVMLAALAQVRNSTHESVVKRLFQMADVNVRARQHGQTALMLAVSHGREDMSRLLLDAGAAVNLQDEDGSTALMCAAEHGHGDIVRLLLAHPDCDSQILDVDGSSALKIAVEAGHADIGILLYAHQRASRNSPMPGPQALPVPRAGKRQRTTSGHHHHHYQHSALSMSAPASPVAAASSRKFHSSSLSLVDSPKYSL